LPNRTPIFKEIRAWIDKWDYIKLKTFCTVKKQLPYEDAAPRMG
jgi:hypothetical protein